MTTPIEEVNDGNFAKIVLGSTRLVLVDFWAQWCGPCRALAPVVESVAKQYAGSAQVVKLNVDGILLSSKNLRLRRYRP
jgi:thioredoxin 1